MNKITLFFAIFIMAGALNIKAQNLLYSNDFEQGAGDATIIGNGLIEDAADARFGKVFHNAAGGQGIRTNYLLLPDNIFADLEAAASNALTVSFWINRGTATNYWFTPLFTAYGAAPNPLNSWPMFALQSRGLMQVNCAGWCDFTSGQNAAGANVESTFWLDDDEWHFYTATLTPTYTAVYVDAELMNEWNISNDGAGNEAAGIFTNGSELTYICLGGNQAWDWPDPDAAYLFDDIRIYSEAFTQSQITALMNNASNIPNLTGENVRVFYDKNSKQMVFKGLKGNETITIFNTLGQILRSGTMNTLQTSDLTNALYLVKIDNQPNAFKVLVK